MLHSVRTLPTLRPVTLHDRAWIHPLLQAEDSPASFGCFGTMFLWGNLVSLTIARVGDRIISRFDDSEKGISFAFPMGTGPLAPALDCMEAMAQAQGVPLTLVGLTEQQSRTLCDLVPDGFSFTEKRESAEYLYEIHAMSTFAGKKLQKKRNHCNRFEREYPDHRFVPLERAHFADCLTLLDAWEQAHEDGEEAHMRQVEHCALEQALLHYEALGLEGGVLLVHERPVAFTIGERTGQHCFDVRFEKADDAIHGAYPMVCRSFARALLDKYPDLQYLNREEDLGMENLRKSKESYYPALLLRKFEAVRTTHS